MSKYLQYFVYKTIFALIFISSLKKNLFCVLFSLSSVVQEFCRIWRLGISEDDSEYYGQLSTQVMDEYSRQMVEYRATGSYTPSRRFAKIDNKKVWVRVPAGNGLEREITSYETCTFRK
jgi:hypothetical protein